MPKVVLKGKYIPLKPQSTTSSHSMKGITIVDGLMYQNQPFTKTYSWKNAKKYCQNLTLGGYTDWRLPTIKELKKLITKSKNSNSLGYKYYIKKRVCRKYARI